MNKKILFCAAMFMAGIASPHAQEACDAAHYGGMRYYTNTFQFCDTGGSWRSIAQLATGAATDRISTTGVSSGATLGAAVASAGTVSFTLGGTAGAAYLHPTLGLVTSGVSATGKISATHLYLNQQATINKAITVIGTGDANDDILLDSYSDTIANYTGLFGARRARGTSAAPTSVQSGDSIATFAGDGYNGAIYSRAATLEVVAENTWSGGLSAKDAALVFSVMGNGALAEQMRLNNIGYLGLGIASPTARLQIADNIYFDEGNGSTTIGPDIRFSSSGLITAEEGSAG